jgi:DNA-binding transcriptional LysR family regulator
VNGKVMDLNDARLFVRAVDCGGIAAAARTLGVAKSGISQRIARLEASLGVRLVYRTPRHFRMSKAGEQFYRHAKAIVLEAEAAELELGQLNAEPVGTVTITSSEATLFAGLDQVLIAISQSHPKIQVVHRVSNNFISLVEHGIDIAVRAHQDELADSSLAQRRLGYSERWIVAAPCFLAEYGPFVSPDQLCDQSAVTFLNERVQARWILSRADSSVTVDVRPVLSTDDFALLQGAAIAGAGLAILPAGMCAALIASGSLVRVLDDWIAGGSSISLLVPQRIGLLPSRISVQHALVGMQTCTQDERLPAVIAIQSGACRSVSFNSRILPVLRIVLSLIGVHLGAP